MRKELLITVSALSLIASAGIGAAQDKGGNAGQGPGTQQAPAAQPGGGAAERGERMQPSQSQQPRQEDSRDNRAQGNQPNQGAQPRNQAQDRVNPQPKDATTGQGAAGRSGGAALTTEQRTKISTTIRQSNVRPATNVNFNISVGTVVPRSVTLHPLPAAVIEVYPDWRPYRFVLVGDEILVIDPATHRIVAVLDA
jgi:hypothetical protein